MEAEDSTTVKENRVVGLPLSWRWLALGLALSGGAALVALSVDYALPAPLSRAHVAARPDLFSAEIAHEHLVNLTAVGPRVAGSYENEVVSVGVLVAAIREIAARASPHNRVELDVQRASGSFALSFMDGMNNVYRDVQNVVARVRGAGGGGGGGAAILLNCHFDSVPDSPGASDDGAGCAVLLETLRALAATRAPLRHDAVFLFNGAEENILQASHAFITHHKWARSVRAFINIEACGAGGREVMFQAGPRDPWIVEAGGREVMFQAGPRDPWIVEVYAGAVPHPFASSLAQELFESGAIPADTDFRIFRDFGNLSGVDLAWSANGYVYHTRLDTAERVPLGALQRTGDNVLALARGLLASERVRAAVDEGRAPAYFDVLGLCVLAARAPAAAALAAATLALVALKIHLTARDAQRELYVSYATWWRCVAAAAGGSAAGALCGVLAACGVALLLHAAGARLAFYSRPMLLLPLYVAPGVSAWWCVSRRAWRAQARGGWGGWAARGWWGARAHHDALAALWGAALALCAARGLRSGFLPLLWALLPAAADLCARALRLPPARRALLWAAGAALPLLQTCYLLLNTLAMFVPVAGRAGAGPHPHLLPIDVRGDGRVVERAVAGGAVLAAAVRAGVAPAAPRGAGAGAAVRGRGGAGAERRRWPALQRRPPAAPHAVPHAPRHARPAARAPAARRGAAVLGAGAGRQHAAHARRARGRGGGVERRGVRGAPVLRRALLPARAGAAAALLPRPRARPARAAPRRAAQRHGAGRGACPGAQREHRRGARGAGGGARARRGAHARQRGAAPPAAGGALPRAPRLLLLAARGARPALLAGGAALHGRRGWTAGARVAGGARAGRRGQAGAGARAPGRPPAAARGAHRLGRRPAPLPPVACSVHPLHRRIPCEVVKCLYIISVRVFTTATPVVDGRSSAC